MRSITNEIASLRRSLKSVDGSLRRLVPLLSSVASNGAGKTGRVSRHRSRKARASLVLQGRYMGYMRQLKPRQKAQVRKIKEAKGVRAAIATAKALARA
jgi:hypothetical protein